MPDPHRAAGGELSARQEQTYPVTAPLATERKPTRAPGQPGKKGRPDPSQAGRPGRCAIACCASRVGLARARLSRA